MVVLLVPKKDGIGAVLLQGGHPIAYISEKLHGAALNYPTYDKELNALVRTLQTWEHYVVSKEFVIHGFDNIRELYVSNEYFSPIYAIYGHKAQDGFYIAKGYLFKEGRLCIPQGSIRKLLVKESHEGVVDSDDEGSIDLRTNTL
ncbi:uncharacterized protein LOC114424051 [Glycine soja]|uniref:uncharacterized protein LOC114424051 n=1 Tax=Glycine soja TaxID=3848 RepID=UPI00103B57BE|nr:uncharacterized protein LOC114424051 [Glycine soja]